MSVKSKTLMLSGMPKTSKREGLWRDAFQRLSRNRAAVVGGSIILLLLLMAMFAPVIAVKPYDTQVLLDQNKVPTWLVRVSTVPEPWKSRLFQMISGTRSASSYAWYHFWCMS